MATDPPSDLVGRKLGRYVVTAIAGTGGSGAVYRGEDPVLGRAVAIKVLPVAGLSKMDTDWLHRSEQLRARLKHPNIVGLLDIGEQDGLHYLVEEFIEGKTLAAFLSSTDRPPLLVILRIFAGLASALHHAHEQGVIHRDVKPANIMIGPAGVPVLVDFGLCAPCSGDPLLKPGDVCGTPAFMSPEQWRGEVVGPAADIYSCGVCLYEVLAGRRPFKGKDLHELCRQVESDPPDFAPLEGKAPEYVISIIAKCLQKEPSRRYSSGDELRRALETAIDQLEAGAGETISVSMPRPGQTLLLHVEYQEAELPGSYREYEILSHRGGGSFGEVYHARERLSGGEVALKVLKSEWLSDAEAIARFRREATLLARLNHPNVVRLRNFGRYGATFFMALDLFNGPTLGQRMKERPVWPVGEALDCTASIVCGLEAIHGAGVVHRDLKPKNVALEGSRVLIFDFGLARAPDMSKLTVSGGFMGTVEYAAPEQAMGLAVTPAADVYAAGVILYELLSARLPHEADSDFGLLHKKASEPHVPIAQHRPELPEAVAAVVNRLLEPDPEVRPNAAEARRLLLAAGASVS